MAVGSPFDVERRRRRLADRLRETGVVRIDDAAMPHRGEPDRVTGSMVGPLALRALHSFSHSRCSLSTTGGSTPRWGARSPPPRRRR